MAVAAMSTSITGTGSGTFIAAQHRTTARSMSRMRSEWIGRSLSSHVSN